MIKHGAVSPRFATYLNAEHLKKGTISEVDAGLLDNVLPWIKDNTIAKYILSHFEKASREPTS